MRTTHHGVHAGDRRQAAEEVLTNLARAVGTLRCAGSQRLVRLGISMTHFHVLTLLRHHDAMPMGRLAEILDVSVSSATGIIDRMEERGLVERVRVPDDRRIVLVRPTETGLALVDEAELVKSAAMAAALARLSSEQLERMAAAAADLEAAITAELTSDPRYAALVQHSQQGNHGTHGPEPSGHEPLPDPSIERRPVPEPGAASPIPGPAGA
jgi:DNA-binding MarR family transcriptional regulator